MRECMPAEANSAPLRVAQVMGQMNYGGVEAVVMAYYRAINRERVQFDFFVDEGSSLPYADEMKANGARVFVLPSPRHPVAYVRERERIFSAQGYRVVHAHINTLSVLPLLAAKRAGIPVRICHSHSMAHPGEGARTLLKNMLRPLSKRYATKLLACGEMSGEWLYGKAAVAQGRVEILRNAIDISRFAFSQDTREEARASFGLGNAPVFGHIGRFSYQKNHPFLLDIFARIHAECPGALLLLAGEGDGEAEARAQAQALGIAEAVRFLGVRNDAQRLYAAMDVFLLPSFYEGLPVVGVEAQASGLPCLFSTHVTREASLGERVSFLPLGNADVWAKAALDSLSPADRARGARAVADAGFDICREAGRLEALYLTQAEGIQG